MKVKQSLYDAAGGWRILPDSDAIQSAHLVLHFGERELLETPHYDDILRSHYPDAQTVGCRTAGEIVDREVHDNTAVACAVQLASTRGHVAERSMSDAVDSFFAGGEPGPELAAADRASVLDSSDGILGNGSELARELTVLAESPDE